MKSALPVWLLRIALAVVGFVVSIDVTLAQKAARPSTPAPFNIQQVRQRYYSGLDAAKAAAVRQIESEGLQLSYNADGSVIRDKAFEKATTYYQAKQRELLAEVKSDKRRDNEVTVLMESVKAAQGKDTGTGTTSAEFSGALSDRDLTLKSIRDVERLQAAAKERGYHCVPGPGYVKIVELDVVVWEPWRTLSPGTKDVRQDDPEVVPPLNPPRDKEKIAKDDPETALGLDKPSVVQQVKKVEKEFRQDVPLSTQEQHEFIAALAKSAHKSVETVDPKKTQLSISAEDREQFKQLKSRAKTKDDLISPFDRPEAQEQKLKEFRARTGTVYKDCDEKQKQLRADQKSQFQTERRALAEELLEETDPVKQLRLKEKIADAEDKLSWLKRAENLDRATERAIARKNPRLSEKLAWTQPKPDRTNPIHPGELTRDARAAELSRTAREATPVEDYTGARDAWHTAAEANRTVHTVLESPLFTIFSKVVGIPDSWAKTAKKVSKASRQLDKNLFKPTEQAIDSEGFVYETGEGMREYIRREIATLESQGYDVTNPRWHEIIRRKAIVRATLRGTYEGSKFLPGLGKIVQGFEDTYNLTEASVGLVYDTWKSQQTVEMNRFQQEGQLEKALIQVRESRKRLRAQMDSAAKSVSFANQLQGMIPELEAEILELRQRVGEKSDLLRQLGSSATTPTTATVDEDSLAKLGPRMAKVTQLAQAFTKDCEKTIQRVKVGKTPRMELAEEYGALRRRLMDIDAEYVQIFSVLDNAHEFLRVMGDSQEIQKVYQSLQQEYAQALTLAATAEDLAGKLERYRGLYRDVLRCFKEERQRVLDACYYFATRPVGDENLQAVLSNIRGELIGYSIPEYQLDDAGTQVFDLKHESAWLRKMAAEPMAPPVIKAASPADQARVEKLEAQLRELDRPAQLMTAAVEEARDRFKQLRELFEIEPPAFTVTSRMVNDTLVEFTVDGVRIPRDAKLIYSWDLGDGTTGGTPERQRRHKYERPGKYEVQVRVFRELDNLSEDLGVTSTTVTIKGGSSTPSSSPPAGPTVTGLVVTPEIKIAGALVPPEGGVMIGQMKPGQYLGDGMLSIQLAKDSREVTYDFNISLQVKLSTQHYKGPAGLRGFVPPFWRLGVVGKGRGEIDPRSGRFQGSSEDAKWTESVDGVSQDGGRAEGRQLLGVAPERLPWSGRIEGTVDFKTFRGGQGQFEINQLVRGTWKQDSGKPYVVTLPADIAVNGRQPTLRLFPNEVSCQKSYDALSRGQFGGYRKPLPDVGDRAIWTQNKGILVQFGRWQLLMQGYPFMQGTPERHLPLVEQVEKFIPASGWESAIPEQQE